VWASHPPCVDYQNNLVFDINLVVVSPTHVVEEMAKISTIKLA